MLSFILAIGKWHLGHNGPYHPLHRVKCNNNLYRVCVMCVCAGIYFYLYTVLRKILMFSSLGWSPQNKNEMKQPTSLLRLRLVLDFGASIDLTSCINVSGRSLQG